MGAKDPRIDKYIADAGEFARPILTKFREVVHATCPEVTETMKWSSPFFMRKKIFCSMAAFNAHCRIIFWAEGEGREKGPLKVSTLSDLPDKKILTAWLREAAANDEKGGPAPMRKGPPKPAAKTPPDLAAALKKNKKAAATFENFSNSHRREYIDWIVEAKKEETRARRLEQTIAQLAEGKSRHWKYANC